MNDTLEAETIAPVTPAGTDRPKRIAKALAAFYPSQKLSACQAVVAKLHGFPDWHALEQAVKIGRSAGPFDEDLKDDAVVRRRRSQMRIVASDLGDVDLVAVYAPPAEDDPAGLLRAKMCGRRFQQVKACDVVFELLPTKRSHPIRIDPSDAMCVQETAALGSLPRKLGRWATKNIPFQPVVGQALSAFELDVGSCVDILRLGSYWATLCLHYAQTIDLKMAMGTTQLLAEGYSAVHLSYSKVMEDIALAHTSDFQSEEQGRAAVEILTREKRLFERRFYSCLPREDFFVLWAAQPKLFDNHALSVLKMLGD